jgi:HD-like signal output (HDOD) protein
MIGQQKSLRDRAIRVLAKLPPLSAGASRFLGALSKRDVENGQLVAIIQRDPMLAPRVLELANSGVFGRLRRVDSLSHAVALIGPNTLRRYGFRWTFGGLFRHLPDSRLWSTSKFTTHAEATALLTDIVCDQLPMGNHGDAAFVAGLVHDIGKFVICAEAPDKVEFILTARTLGGESVPEIERSVLGISHAEISSMAADTWRLGDDVCQAIFYHHEPDRDRSGRKIALSTVLSKCDAFINGLGWQFLSTRSDATDKLELPGYDDEIERALETFQTSLETNGIVV